MRGKKAGAWWRHIFKLAHGPLRPISKNLTHKFSFHCHFGERRGVVMQETLSSPPDIQARPQMRKFPVPA